LPIKLTAGVATIALALAVSSPALASNPCVACQGCYDIARNKAILCGTAGAGTGTLAIMAASTAEGGALGFAVGLIIVAACYANGANEIVGCESTVACQDCAAGGKTADLGAETIMTDPFDNVGSGSVMAYVNGPGNAWLIDSDKLAVYEITQNVYDGSQWWGTISIKNTGPLVSAAYDVAFDVPSGRHCTADAVPPGATLSPLTGSGTSAHTVGNHCVFHWASVPTVAVGTIKTFNYSTDSQNFAYATNPTVVDRTYEVNSKFSITTNKYDGPNWWGTVSFKNNNSTNCSPIQVSFDVPSGVHCTADAVPSAATLAPLSGSGTSAHTSSNHCLFTWPNLKLAPGASKTFNFSTDSSSSSFKAATNVVVGGFCH
jgi:hypothetical protein